MDDEERFKQMINRAASTGKSAGEMVSMISKDLQEMMMEQFLEQARKQNVDSKKLEKTK